MVKTIVVEVRGGLVEDITGIPDGIQVEVRDYDIQDYWSSPTGQLQGTGEGQKIDSRGLKYREEIWS